MNETLSILRNHRSVRQFTDTPLTEEEILTLVEAAQSASTSSFIQAYSIIGVKNRDTKKELARLAGGQDYVLENGHFFIFCADLHRHTVAAEMEDVSISDTISTTEKFIVATVDASLAAQNASIAAESLGLGICYIGGLRNNIEAVSELLQLPDHVIPLYGLAVGHPAGETAIKPRLPVPAVYMEETYANDKDAKVRLTAYNETISDYYKERTGGKRNDSWTSQMTNMLATPSRLHMKEFVQGKGMMKS
ncbi:oxygen-insensitive NADPH nitroreductase [Paenalkalicoccus suaedae]|uniref:Oxygen-insensitive NADPH nitroreductase n=1 Tax=Paenalkalicoccus suaedae TaxID=2592382 RepID=A0A859FE02_9BACI|nr:oxygen-insensitive NADPH nitroreductase [Paenalkalicoccus suaedae]QKS71593.1 oxygen-insensitive NADPH nitroreductase [Paenalkalicoccus suaedae]